MQTSASSLGKSEYLMKMTKASLVIDQVVPRPDEVRRLDEVRRPGPDFDQMQKPLQVHVWNHEAYQDGTNVSG